MRDFFSKFKKSPKVFIIAEAGSNHLCDIKRVYKLIDIASEAGADAVKFQSFSANEIATQNPKYNKIKNKFKKYSNNLHSFYRKYEMPKHFYKKIINYCKKKKIIFMTSIFGMESFEDTKNINPIVKIASFEINYFELFQEIIRKRKPIIISTGCSYENEIKKTVNFFKKKKYKQFALMHCGSDYPLQFKEANLNYIKKMKKLFPSTVIGYSDHTLNISSCIAAVSLGAKIIEKHFTISQKDRAPDSFFSLEKKELKELIKNVREIEKSLGQDKKIISKKILRMRNVGMRSYYSTENFNKGVLIKKGMFKALRPHAKKTIAIDDFKIILNKKLRKNISKNEPLKKEHIY